MVLVCEPKQYDPMRTGICRRYKMSVCVLAHNVIIICINRDGIMVCEIICNNRLTIYSHIYMVHLIHPYHWTIPMEISVKIKSVYGIDKIYPVCDKAVAFANIADTVTLTDYTIAKIKLLGYRVKVVPITMEL